MKSKVFVLVLLGLIVLAVNARGDIVHRYSFDVDGKDQIGTADMTIGGDAVVEGGDLVLPGGATRVHNAHAEGDAVTEIAGSINGSDAITMEMWFQMNAEINWSKLMMTGTDTSQYMDMTPRRGDGSDASSCSLRTGGDELNVRNGNVLAVGTEYYMAAIWDEVSNSMTIVVIEAGNPESKVVETSTMGGFDLANLAINQFYLGSAVGWGDGDANCQIDEFRIHNHAMTQEQIDKSFTAGPDAGVKAVSPADGSIDINSNIDLNLDWTDFTGEGTVQEFQLYFGDDADLVRNATSGYTVVPAGTTEYLVSAAELASDSSYAWRVDYTIVSDPNTYKSFVADFDTNKTLPILTAPAGTRVHLGESAEFSVGITTGSTVVSVAWFMEVADGDDIELTGAKYDVVFDDTSTMLTIADAQEIDADNYYCIVTNSAGAQDSVSGTLFIKHRIAYWSFDEGAGTDASDADGNLDCVIDTSDENTGAQWTTEGLSGSAIVFDGTDDSLVLGPTADPNFVPAGNPTYSIVAWVKPDTTSNSRGILGWGNYGSGSQVNAFKLTGNQVHNYWWGADMQVTVDDIDVTDGQWHMVAATFDGMTRSIWFDGVLRGSDTPGSNNLPEGGPNFAIGVTNMGEFFSGIIDEVAMFDYGLDELEVADVYYKATGNSVCVSQIEFDMNDDCIVDVADFAIFAAKWLDCNLYPDCIDEL